MTMWLITVESSYGFWHTEKHPASVGRMCYNLLEDQKLFKTIPWEVDQKLIWRILRDFLMEMEV